MPAQQKPSKVKVGGVAGAAFEPGALLPAVHQHRLLAAVRPGHCPGVPHRVVNLVGVNHLSLVWLWLFCPTRTPSDQRAFNFFGSF